MMEQLENSPDSESKAQLVQNLESKVVDLQSQLRVVREQIETGALADKQSPPPASKYPAFYGAPRGGVSGGRRGGGRFPYYAGRYPSAAARGFGRGGGRGGRSWSAATNNSSSNSAAAATGAGEGSDAMETADGSNYAQETEQS
jgi:hypothetical protein